MNSSLKSADRRLILPAAFLFVAFLLAGCATAPVPASIDQVLQQPQAYEGKRVELTGLVKEYKPAQGDVYRTLLFTLSQDSGGDIWVIGAGYTAEAIAKASLLVEQAFEAREPVTVVGKLKKNKQGPPELQLQSIRYKGQEIEIKKGPTTRGSGFSIGGGVVSGSIGIGATITP
jgi:starvation-inducible outer membrane lipoprotein